MRQFFKFLFASCLGTMIALFFMFFMVMGVGSAIASLGEMPTVITANSVLHLKLDAVIPELMDNVETSKFEFNPKRTLGLHDITAAIKYAKTDDDIKGIFLEADQLATGYTSTATIRAAIEDFKASGKFVHSYAPYYSQGAYYLASVSDKVTMAPLGMVDWRGFSSAYMFYKDALERLDVHFEVFYAGRFKSASEPYRRNDMSPESRIQTRAFLDEMYRLMLADVSDSRGLTTAQLRQMANEYTGINPEAALEGKLIDEVIYREAFLNEMREEIGIEVDDEINFVRLGDYHTTKIKTEEIEGSKIAILVAEGVIIDGKGEASQIGDKDYVKLIEDLRKDDNVKAVVLRVNSPGGSAMASDHIWQALMDLKATGKPLVVSMGSVAASGGYYIACAADSIYAEPSTITGSIGVVSAIPQLQGLLNNKLGVHVDSVKTGPYATAINPLFNMSPNERILIQNRTDMMYQTFLSRVSEGRGLSMAEADSIAQGRVWVGTTAAEIGLVDQLGDLEDAIQTAADMADMSDYKTQIYPTPLHPLQRMMNELVDPQEMMKTSMMKDELGSLYPHYMQMKDMTENKGLQMRLPLVFDFQ